MPQEPAPKTPLQKSGWNLMLLGFFIVLLSGAAYLASSSLENPMLRKVGTSLWITGLVVYVFGRIQRFRGRPKD